METKVQNIIKVPVSHSDLQKLTKAINEAPNPLFGSPMDLLKKFTLNMYRILVDYDNDKNVEMKDELIESINNMYQNSNIDSIFDLIPNSNSPQLTMRAMPNPANSKQPLDMKLPGLNPENKTIQNSKLFTEQSGLDRTIRLKLKSNISNRLLQLTNFNETALTDLLSLYIHRIAQNFKIIYPQQEKPDNIFINGGYFTYALGFEKESPLLKDTMLHNYNINELNSFKFYKVNNKAQIDNDANGFTSHFDFKKPIQYGLSDLQKQYINRILTIRKHAREISVDNLYLNPTRTQPKPDTLSAFDYLNILFNDIMSHGHMETKDLNELQFVRKYEDPIPVTAFLLQQFNKMKAKHEFGFAQDLLFRYGEKFDKETQVELIKHLNDYTVLQFEKTSTFSSYANYNIKSLVELSPETLKSYILETFDLKNVDEFRNFLSNNPQWIK